VTIRYVAAVPGRSATGLVGDAYAQIRREFGAVVEPFALHSPAPRLLAGVWIACRESLLVGGAPRSSKETVAVAVSDLNACPYCVDAHTVMLHAGGRHEGARSGPAGRGPAEAAAISDWARATRSPGHPRLAAPPFDPELATEFVATALTFHYINRMVSALLDERLLPGGPLHGLSARAAGLYFARAVRRRRRPGESLGLLPDAPLPGDLAWASGSPALAGALARFAAVVEDEGGRALPPAARRLVSESLTRWHGEDRGLSLAWLDDELEPLAAPDRAAGRLALLAAYQPHRLSGDLVASLRRSGADDRRLLGALAWPSLAAARRIASWAWPAGAAQSGELPRAGSEPGR
jgi:AhpD family alkylhydroperoxidase